jgi:hypothetical protein
MEATAFFERKIALCPRDLNKIKGSSIDDILTVKLIDMIEGKCSEHGFVLPGSIKIISRSMGYYEHARFTGDAVYFIKASGKVLYPADGIHVTGEVIRKNKLGLYVLHRNALRIQVPRDLHIGNEEFDRVEIGDTVEVELKKSRFQINDPFILTNGIFHKITSSIVPTEVKNEVVNAVVKKEEGGEEESEEEEGEEEEGEGEGEEEEGEGEGEEEEESEEEESEEEEEEDENEGEKTIAPIVPA